MANNTTTQHDQSQGNAPDFIAWHITEKDDKSYWHRIGASWKHKDRKGFTLQLEIVPINGRIVLRAPREPDLFDQKERV